MFKETDPRSSFDCHNDPIPQYVITLAGVLEFTMVGGETFTLRPDDVLLAVDHWRLINAEPWKRAYVVFKQGADIHFVLDTSSIALGGSIGIGPGARESAQFLEFSGVAEDQPNQVHFIFERPDTWVADRTGHMGYTFSFFLRFCKATCNFAKNFGF